MTLEGKTILFFAGPLYEDLELWYPKIRLEEEGARIRHAGWVPISAGIVRGKRGTSVGAIKDLVNAGMLLMRSLQSR